MIGEQENRVRDYGGWRQRRGIGLWGFSTGATLTILAGAAAVILAAAVGIRLLEYVTMPAFVIGVLAVARFGGESAASRVTRRLRWRWASVRGYTRYRAAVVTELPGGFTLPGVLAPAELLSAEDGFGGRYGLIRDRRTGMLTPTLRVVAAPTWLADRGDADRWVAGWGGWLASLGYIPMVRWVTVTVDTAPEPGSVLADAVAATIDPAAPEAAKRILTGLADAAPASAADVDTRVSLTFDPRASAAAGTSDLTGAAAEVGRVLTGLESALGACGVTVLGRMDAAGIAGVVRAAFDPAARGEVLRIAGQARTDPGTTACGDGSQSRTGPGPGPLQWADAGPVGAEEFPDYYRHDGGFSVTWAWHEAPRQNVTADVLTRLISPGPYPKRVSLQYRPFPAAAATRVLEAEVNAASFRQSYRGRTGRDETARDAYDQARARQAAAEEAAGAGVCLMSLFVTVTVATAGEMPRAAAWIEAAAESSKIRLRRMTYSQAAGFAATLPCGVCPADLARRMPH